MSCVGLFFILKTLKIKIRMALLFPFLYTVIINTWVMVICFIWVSWSYWQTITWFWVSSIGKYFLWRTGNISAIPITPKHYCCMQILVTFVHISKTFLLIFRQLFQELLLANMVPCLLSFSDWPGMSNAWQWLVLLPYNPLCHASNFLSK